MIICNKKKKKVDESLSGHLGIDFAHFLVRAFAAPSVETFCRPGIEFQTLAIRLEANVG